MQGKVCLVTGATAGIGQVAATELCRRGAHVVIVGRSSERCAATLASMRTATGADRVDSLVADLSSLSEVRRLAGLVRERYPRLDVFCNNAGAMFWNRSERRRYRKDLCPQSSFLFRAHKSSLAFAQELSTRAGSSMLPPTPTKGPSSISTTFNSRKSIAAGKLISSQSSPILCLHMSWPGGPQDRVSPSTRFIPASCEPISCRCLTTPQPVG